MSRSIVIKENWRANRALQPVVEWMNLVAHCLNNMRQGTEYARVTRDGIVLPPAEAAGAFSGRAYVNGKEITGLDSDADKPWVRCILAAQTAEEATGPAPNPFPPNEEWYHKGRTFGDIHAGRL